MRVREFAQLLESWAPREVAWEKDNPGLQCGDPSAEVHGILISLDATEEVVREAQRKRRNLILTHHPLLFRPVRSVTPETYTGRVLEACLRWRIAVFSAHTNLDFSPGGTSEALAASIGIPQVTPLHRPFHLQRKIVTFVPEKDVERVAAAMGNAGAGSIGEYDLCSFRTEGTGTFRGSSRATPAVGRTGRLERVPEIRLEMVVPAWRVDPVVRAMRAAHPYEEVAYDVIPLDTAHPAYGAGVVGDLRPAIPLRRFLASISRGLGAKGVRYTTGRGTLLRRVALCGGSGSDLLEEAIRSGADAFVTADVRYHTFQEARGRIALIDAGHYETEYPVVRTLARRLRAHLRRTGISLPVDAATTSTNPIHSV